MFYLVFCSIQHFVVADYSIKTFQILQQNTNTEELPISTLVLSEYKPNSPILIYLFAHLASVVVGLVMMVVLVKDGVG